VLSLVVWPRRFYALVISSCFGRRARAKKGSDADKERTKRELDLLLEHALFREYSHINEGGKEGDKDSLPDRVIAMLKDASDRFAKLTADWIRVGYVQGNFNSDNCLVAGRTMDYGPFGFIEMFTPLWNMWTGGGEHYGFLNQPTAGGKNFEMLVTACLPALDGEHAKKAKEIMHKHTENAKNALNDAWRQKLGVEEWNHEVQELNEDLMALMEQSGADYTMLWRQLSYVAERMTESEDEKLYEPLKDVFYKSLSDREQQKWVKWIKRYTEMLSKSGKSGDEIGKQMRKVSPKFIPREWMLVQAYTAADNEDYCLLEELQDLFQTPYDEHDEEMTSKYYKKAPMATYAGSGLGGTAFMT